MKTNVTKSQKKEPLSSTVASNGETLKHLQVREAITLAIRSGEFPSGSRLPGERELARRFGASHMTARRAVTEMIEADLLERRTHQGTFVRSHGHRQISTVTVNLIYPQHHSSLLGQFLQFSIDGLEARGWRHHFIPLQNERERAAVRALENAEPALVMASGTAYDSSFKRALEKAKSNVVLLGNQSPGSGVPSVMADDAQAMRLLMDYLQSAGHRAIGLVSNHPQHAVDQTQVATWRACCARDATPEELEHRLIVVNTESHSLVAQPTFDAVRNYLQGAGGDVTALICLSEELTWATIAACRAVGRPVPEKMSVVASSDSPLLQHFNPPVTCVDIHLERHIEIALKLLDVALQDQPVGEQLSLVAPSLIVRESVSAPFKAELSAKKSKNQR